MSDVSPDQNRECSRCAGILAPDALVCSSCHALVHAATLDELAAAARLHEQEHRYAEARDIWLNALDLLPADSAQAEWIRANTERLQGLAGAAASSARPSWAQKLGPLAPLAIVLAKGKLFVSLLKLKFLFSLGAFVAFYWALYGMKFGIGFALLILVHEMGHFIAIKRRGLPADMPVFLPGLGAYVRWAALGVSLETRAFVSLAGPFAGCVGSAVCALLWMKSGDPLWIGLASLSALLNVLNLIPLWVLDGGQAIGALDKTERLVVSAAAVLFAALFGQPAFLLVAGGAGYRAFDKNIPLSPSHTATLYYVLLLAALGYLLKLGPLVPPGAT